jgi:transketolase
MRDSGRIALLGVGNMLPTALETADALSQQGHEARVYSFHTVKPLDTRLLHQLCESCDLLATLEEHSAIGGLGSAVAEWMADTRLEKPPRLVRCGTPDEFLHQAGEQEFARHLFGLDAAAIAKRILEHL